jgi:hypothetical protein
MITAKLNGGLGNQMFQIATAYSIALDNNDECAFNFDNKVVYQGNPARTYKSNLFKNIKELSNDWEPEFIYKESRLDYDPISYHKNMLLEGYFGSDKYFNHHKKEIVDLLGKRRIVRRFDNSVSLHVRRGDYLKFPDIHPTLSMDYYKKALKYIDNQVRITNIYVLSDDLGWCRDNFDDRRITFADGLTDYECMVLQFLCNHNIIANSSFSWWGSYLNEYSDKIICAPKIWHGEGLGQTCKDIFCDNWILI